MSRKSSPVTRFFVFLIFFACFAVLLYGVQAFGIFLDVPKSAPAIVAGVLSLIVK